jgi:antitoxin MazE
MRVQIAKWGNSAAVRLPKAIVEALRVKPGEEVEIVVEAGEARLRPVRKRPVSTLAEMVAEMKRLGPENEPPFEDWGPDRGAEIIDDDYSK